MTHYDPTKATTHDVRLVSSEFLREDENPFSALPGQPATVRVNRLRYRLGDHEVTIERGGDPMDTEKLAHVVGLTIQDEARSTTDPARRAALLEALRELPWHESALLEDPDLALHQDPVTCTGALADTAPGELGRAAELDVPVTLRITDLPSRSKGWARAKLTGPAGPVISSNTGNEWVGGAPTYAGEAAEGTALDLTLECNLKTGQSRGTRREERTAETYRLIARAGAAETIEYRPGSQGITVEITGARLVGVHKLGNLANQSR